MRDALSVWTSASASAKAQSPPTRVREVLGLADDELYAEVLRLVVDREPGAVFPLVDRLSRRRGGSRRVHGGRGGGAARRC